MGGEGVFIDGFVLGLGFWAMVIWSSTFLERVGGEIGKVPEEGAIK